MQAPVDERHPAGGDVRAGDPFGTTVGERIWRRLAGVGVSVTAACGFLLWTTELLPWVLLGVLVTYLLGVPTSWFVARWAGAPVPTHALAAFALVVVVTAGLVVVAGPAVVPFAVVALATGVPAAMLAAWAGSGLPRRWVPPVALLGLLITVVALPLGTWLQLRPPAPHDYVVVHEPAELRSLDDPHELAERIATQFERQAAAGSSRTAHATWVAVGDVLHSGPLAGAGSGSHYSLDEDLPTLAGSREPVRLVTTIVDGRPERGCVVVTADSTRVEPRACAELDLTG